MICVPTPGWISCLAVLEPGQRELLSLPLSLSPVCGQMFKLLRSDSFGWPSSEIQTKGFVNTAASKNYPPFPVPGKALSVSRAPRTAWECQRQRQLAVGVVPAQLEHLFIASRTKLFTQGHGSLRSLSSNLPEINTVKQLHCCSPELSTSTPCTNVFPNPAKSILNPNSSLCKSSETASPPPAFFFFFFSLYACKC